MFDEFEKEFLLDESEGEEMPEGDVDESELEDEDDDSPAAPSADEEEEI